MPLNRIVFKAGLKALMLDMSQRTSDPAQAREDYADTFGDLLCDLIESATITGTVTTTGSAAAQTGTITTATIR